METNRTKVLFIVGLVIGLSMVGVVVALTGGSDVSDDVTLKAPQDGPEVTITGSTEVDLEQPFPDSNTVYIESDDGIIEFTSSGSSTGTVAASDIEGAFTVVSNIEASVDDLTINPDDKLPVTVGNGIDTIEWPANVNLDDGGLDFRYTASANPGKVSLDVGQANTKIVAIDTTNNDIRDVATSDSNGVVTFTDLDTATDSGVYLRTANGDAPQLTNLRDDGTSGTTTQELFVDVDDADFDADTVTLEWYVDGNLETTTTAQSAGTYSITVTNLNTGNHDYYVKATDDYDLTTTTNTNTFEVETFGPVISDIQPSGDLDAEPTNISAQVNDSDFTGAGDSVDVEISLDGSVVHTETIGSNQEVNISMPSSGQLGGSHTIEVSAQDQYGDTTTATETYKVPGDLFVRNETNHSQLLSVDGEVRFFPGDSQEGSQVYSRTATDGIINMTGLPVNQDFLVEVVPTNSNYTQRTIYIESIYEQESAYLLNTSKYATVESRFILNDPTGRYDSESILKILRPIEINGSVEYQTIIGDQFGTEGVTATLQEQVRYQLRVSADEFEQAVGPYRADTSETVEVQPGTSSIDLSNVETWAADAAIDNQTIEYLYDDPTQSTDKLVVYIHERNNESNQPIGNQTFTDLGEASGQITIPADQADQEWVVEFVVNRNDDEFVKTVTLSNRKNLTPPLSSAWKGIIGVGLLVLMAGAFSVLNAAVGAVIVSLFGGLLYYIGFLGGATSGLAVGIAIFISVVGHVMSSSR